MGYIEQLGLKKGFIPGPKAYMLSDNAYKNPLKELATPLVHECAEKIHESVLIATLSNCKRYILYHHNGNAEIQVRIDQPFYEDLYTTATGRLLLAFASEPDVCMYADRHGFPGKAWSDINSLDELFKTLAKIKREKFVLSAGRQVIIMAYPVYQNSNVVAVLGSSVPSANFVGKNREFILAELSNTAERITAALNN
jgi:DNA-binding IclR family transcriptional regulator